MKILRLALLAQDDINRKIDATKNSLSFHWTAPVCADSTKKPLCRQYLVLSGVAQRQRRHSCFILDALVVIEVDVPVDQIVGFSDCLRLVSVDALRF